MYKGKWTWSVIRVWAYELTQVSEEIYRLWTDPGVRREIQIREIKWLCYVANVLEKNTRTT